MQIEEQVITLSQARKLYELGVMQNSLFYFFQSLYRDGERLDPKKGNWQLDYKSKYHVGADCLSAFTVGELGKMLPEYVGEWFLEMYKDSSNLEDKEWFLVRYVEDDGGNFDNIHIKIGFNLPNEAEARAEILIYLLENNMIDNGVN